MIPQLGFAEKLERLLSGYPVDIVYLFGSAGAGTAKETSDLDIGILFSRNLDVDRRFDLRLELYGKLSVLSEKQLDITVLNDSPTGLSYEVMKTGEIVYCRDEEIRYAYELKTMSAYLDRRYYDKRRAQSILKRFR